LKEAWLNNKKGESLYWDSPLFMEDGWLVNIEIVLQLFMSIRQKQGKIGLQFWL